MIVVRTKATALELLHAYEGAQRDVQRAEREARLAIAVSPGSPEGAASLQHLTATRKAEETARHALADRLMYLKDGAR